MKNKQSVSELVDKFLGQDDKPDFRLIEADGHPLHPRDKPEDEEDEEEEEECDEDDILETFLKVANIRRFEGGTNNLVKVINALNPEYRDVDDFLADNPGAQEAIIEFITGWIDRSPDWRENMRKEIRSYR